MSEYSALPKGELCAGTRFPPTLALPFPVPREADWSARDAAVFSHGPETFEDVKPADHRAALYVMRPGHRAAPVTQA